MVWYLLISLKKQHNLSWGPVNFWVLLWLLITRKDTIESCFVSCLTLDEHWNHCKLNEEFSQYFIYYFTAVKGCVVWYYARSGNLPLLKHLREHFFKVEKITPIIKYTWPQVHLLIFINIPKYIYFEPIQSFLSLYAIL